MNQGKKPPNKPEPLITLDHTFCTQWVKFDVCVEISPWINYRQTLGGKIFHSTLICTRKFIATIEDFCFEALRYLSLHEYDQNIKSNWIEVLHLGWIKTWKTAHPSSQRWHGKFTVQEISSDSLKSRPSNLLSCLLFSFDSRVKYTIERFANRFVCFCRLNKLQVDHNPCLN